MTGAQLATVALAAVAIAVGGLLVGGGGTARITRRRRMGLDPDAHLATPTDLAPLWVTRPTRGRITIGTVGPRWHRRRVATENPAGGLDRSVPLWRRRQAARRSGQRGAVLVVGPSQCGKTAALAIPAILEWDGPLLALSVKNDLLAATYAHRAAVGDVQVFDPTAATSHPGATWSPLAGATTLTGARRAARTLANATTWTTGTSSDMGFWTSAAEDLLALLFFAAGAVGVGMGDVVSWVTTMDPATPRSLLRPLSRHTDPALAADGQAALAGFTGLWAADRRQISSTYLIARQIVAVWQEPAIAASAANPRITLDRLLDPGPNGDKANSLYLCADLDEADRLAPVLGGLLDDLMHQAYTRAGHTDSPLDPPLLVVIDEAGNWPLRTLPGRISTAAGLGIHLLLVFQSKAQIDAAYGPKADIVLSNAITKVFFAGQSDRSTLDYAAGLLGHEHVVAHSTSTDHPGLLPADRTGTGGRVSRSQAPTLLELLPAALLRQVLPGQALLIHNTLPPAHLHGRYWYRDPDLHHLATGQRLGTRELAVRAARRRIHAPDRLPGPDADVPGTFPAADPGQFPAAGQPPAAARRRTRRRRPAKRRFPRRRFPWRAR